MAEFLIIRHKIEMPLVTFGCVYQWAKVTARRDSNGELYASLKDIESKEAHRLISDHKLTKVVDNEYGKIWDDGSFKEKYGDYIKII